ncbi:MAG: TIGR01440 family protein, partial [Clostridia bacterium]
MNEIARQIREAVDALVTLSHLQAGALVVLGCSTSEMVGGRIGQNAQPILGRVVAQAAIDACAAHGVELAVQCCEHLNRALVMERATLVRRGFRQVMAVPMPHAGGSCGAAAYRLMRDPVLAEHVEADAGLDIGDTMIGMHLRHVAVPLRAKIRRIGAANLVLAGTRPPYIGGPRAKYERNREEETMNAKFALQLYSVREAYAADLEGTLRQVAEMGYTGVEGFGDFTYPAARIKAALEANHLVLVGWHTGLAQWEDERFDQTVAYFQALHNTRAVVPWADPDVYATRTDAMSFAERLNALSKRLAP